MYVSKKEVGMFVVKKYFVNKGKYVKALNNSYSTADKLVFSI